MLIRPLRLALVLLTLVSSALSAADWPHWLGPNGDNRVAEAERFTPDLAKWTVAWEAEVGRGYSSIAVADGRAITLGHDGQGQETVTCRNAATGAVRWQFSYPAKLLPAMHPGGPNATATVVGERVIVMSKDGQIFCCAVADGKHQWTGRLDAILGIKLPTWGFASSPVVSAGRVLFTAGKTVALDLETGKPVWTTATEYRPGYTTAVVFARDGKRCIAALDGGGLSVLNESDGAEIARHPFKNLYEMTATTPMILDGGKRLFMSGNAGSDLVAFDGATLSQVWRSTEIKNTMNNSVLLDGVLYGIDGKQGQATSRLVAVNAADGVVKWAQADIGFGNTIGIGRHVFALTEEGVLISVLAKPDAFHEIARRQVLPKTCWTPPTYAAGRLYLRNDAGHVVCLSPP